MKEGLPSESEATMSLSIHETPRVVVVECAPETAPHPHVRTRKRTRSATSPVALVPCSVALVQCSEDHSVSVRPHSMASAVSSKADSTAGNKIVPGVSGRRGTCSIPPALVIGSSAGKRTTSQQAQTQSSDDEMVNMVNTTVRKQTRSVVADDSGKMTSPDWQTQHKRSSRSSSRKTVKDEPIQESRSKNVGAEAPLHVLGTAIVVLEPISDEYQNMAASSRSSLPPEKFTSVNKPRKVGRGFVKKKKPADEEERAKKTPSAENKSKRLPDGVYCDPVTGNFTSVNKPRKRPRGFLKKKKHAEESATEGNPKDEKETAKKKTSAENKSKPLPDGVYCDPVTGNFTSVNKPRKQPRGFLKKKKHAEESATEGNPKDEKETAKKKTSAENKSKPLPDGVYCDPVTGNFTSVNKPRKRPRGFLKKKKHAEESATEGNPKDEKDTAKKKTSAENKSKPLPDGVYCDPVTGNFTSVNKPRKRARGFVKKNKHAEESATEGNPKDEKETAKKKTSAENKSKPLPDGVYCDPVTGNFTSVNKPRKRARGFLKKKKHAEESATEGNPKDEKDTAKKKTSAENKSKPLPDGVYCDPVTGNFTSVNKPRKRARGFVKKKKHAEESATEGNPKDEKEAAKKKTLAENKSKPLPDGVYCDSVTGKFTSVNKPRKQRRGFVKKVKHEESATEEQPEAEEETAAVVSGSQDQTFTVGEKVQNHREKERATVPCPMSTRKRALTGTSTTNHGAPSKRQRRKTYQQTETGSLTFPLARDPVSGELKPIALDKEVRIIFQKVAF